MDTSKVTGTLMPKTGDREPQQNYRIETVSNRITGGLN